MYDQKHRFHVIKAGEEYGKYEQKGVREHLLCQSCETKFSKWENYARGILTGTTPLQYGRDEGITWVHGIEYHSFKLFQLSILWRSAVSKHEFFSKVTLGPHAELIRKMLLDNDPGEPWQYGCLTIGMHRLGNMVPIIMQPTPFKILGTRGMRFTYGGYFWAYRIAQHRPVEAAFLEAVLQKSGRLALKFENWEDGGFHKDFIRNHHNKRRDS